MKSYLLTADKKGYGPAGKTVPLSDRQAEFLVMTGAMTEVREDAAPPVPAPVATGTGDGKDARTRKIKAVETGV